MKKQAFVVLFSTILQAQVPTETSIATDRPDQTETAFLVPKGRFQMENGFCFSQQTQKNFSINFAESLWKYGFSKRIEFRMITGFLKENSDATETKGFRPIAFGTKIKLTEENGIFPKISWIGHAHVTPSASKVFRNEKWAPEFRFAFLHNLNSNQTLSYNLGIEWDANGLFPIYIYTFSYGYSVSECLGAYIEVFGNISKEDSAQHLFDGGLTYLLSPNFMLDCSAGFGLHSSAPKYYYSAGFSFRI